MIHICTTYDALILCKIAVQSKWVCELYDDFYFNLRDEDYKAIGGGVFLTEFGADSDGKESTDEITWMMDSVEKLGQTSWTYWQYKYYNDYTTADMPAYTESLWFGDGNLQIHKIKALSRTYMLETCGIPLSSKFNATTGDFSFSYEYNKCTSKQSLLFLNEELIYTKGFSIEVFPEFVVTFEQKEKNYVIISHKESLEVGEEIRVVVRTK